MANMEYLNQYEKENIRQIRFKLNRKTEPEMLAWIEQQDNIQGYLKKLISEDMKKEEKTMKNVGWHIAHRFTGKLNRQELNEKIRFETGVEEPFCETEEDFDRAIKEGWITFDGNETIVWEDGIY